VDDISEPPVRATGQQSVFIGGVAAACAGLHAALGRTPGATVDVSLHEALATLAMTELTRVGLTGRSWQRKRLNDGNGATVCILPASDGYAAISPREEKQWQAWLEAMGSPEWGTEPRFAKKADRIANWDALHALMSEWSRQHPKQWIADTAQAAHVPSFPLRELAQHFGSPQLAEHGFWRQVNGAEAPGFPAKLSHAEAPPKPLPAEGALPLSGLRVLDFSWVIAGPTATRHLAAMGAEVIKVEAPGKGDPGRGSELHTVLGQAKKAIVLDLKQPDAVAIARRLAATSDVLIENFATGVMNRLGLGAAELQAENPDLTYVSASGMGRTGPEAKAVAYGTLLQCYAGFAGLNRHPERPPRVGFAWLDPMCGLLLPFLTAAGLWRRARAGGGTRVDLSMVEALLWTMAEPVLAAQSESGAQPLGNRDPAMSPHGVYPSAGEDAWVSLAVQGDVEWQALCGLVPGLDGLKGHDLAERQAKAETIDAAIAAWTADRTPAEAAAQLTEAGIAAAPVASSADLLASPHLAARSFWDRHGDSALPGLPWRASFGRQSGDAPGLGEHTEAVLAELHRR
jgi:crotonobetainyl-CoA:carnitine CoA-transferase CaiB-like acyl-CoA transferase